MSINTDNVSIYCTNYVFEYYYTIHTLYTYIIYISIYVIINQDTSPKDIPD